MPPSDNSVLLERTQYTRVPTERPEKSCEVPAPAKLPPSILKLRLELLAPIVSLVIVQGKGTPGGIAHPSRSPSSKSSRVNPPRGPPSFSDADRGRPPLTMAVIKMTGTNNRKNESLILDLLDWF